MKDEIVSYKVAKLAKEKKFNLDTLYFYCDMEGMLGKTEIKDDSKHLPDYDKQTENYLIGMDPYPQLNIANGYYNWNSLPKNSSLDMITCFSENVEKEVYSAPTQALLSRWLREEYNTLIEVWYNFELVKYECTIYSIAMEEDERKISNYTIDGKTYESTLENGLYEALNLI